MASTPAWANQGVWRFRLPDLHENIRSTALTQHKASNGQEDHHRLREAVPITFPHSMNVLTSGCSSNDCDLERRKTCFESILRCAGCKMVNRIWTAVEKNIPYSWAPNPAAITYTNWKNDTDQTQTFLR